MDSWQQIDCMMPFSWVCKGHPENIVSTSTTAPTRNNESAVRFMIVFHKPRLYSIKGLVYASIYYIHVHAIFLPTTMSGIGLNTRTYICVWSSMRSTSWFHRYVFCMRILSCHIAYMTKPNICRKPHQFALMRKYQLNQNRLHPSLWCVSADLRVLSAHMRNVLLYLCAFLGPANDFSYMHLI